MKVNHRIRRLAAALAAMMLMTAGCAEGLPAAGEPALKDMRLDLGGSSVAYPMLTGMEDQELQQEINSRIQADLDVEAYLSRMTLLMSEENLRVGVTWAGEIAGDVLSCVMSAEGALRNNRSTHRWTAANIDLRNGQQITLGALFADEAAAREALAEYLETQVAPEMSAHLNNSELLPLPETFRLEAAGLTLLYPAEQLSTLSGRAGDIRIGWNEIREYLDMSPEGIPARTGAEDMITLTAESAGKIREMTEQGCLPGIPAVIGEALKPLTDRYHLLTDPDVYEGGRLFSPEGGCFRDVYLMTDYLSEDWDDSTVRGIRMDRGCAWGLCIGETRQEAWREILGEPEHSVTLTEEMAEERRREAGMCDYYRFGEHQLQLYTDAEGTLLSITLTE